MKNKKLLIVVLAIAMVFALVAFAACEQLTPEPIDEEPNQFTVTFDKNGGAGVVAPITVDEGSKISAPNGITKEGYTLKGWYNGETKWNFEQNTVTTNVTLKAVWEARIDITCTIEVYKQKVQDGAPIEEYEKLASANYPTGLVAELTDRTFDTALDISTQATSALSDSSLVGYQLNTTMSKLSIEHLAVSGNVLKVYYRIQGFTVTFEGVGEQPIIVNIYPSVSKKASAPQVSKEGYVLDGFYNGETKWDFATDEVTEDITLTAKWTERNDIPYSIEVYIQDHDGATVLDTFSKLSEAQFPQGFQAEYNNGKFGSTWSIESDAEDALELEMLKGFAIDEEQSVLSMTLALTDNVFKIYYKFVSYTVSFAGVQADSITVYPAISSKLSQPEVALFGGEITSWTYLPQGEETPVAWDFANDEVTSNLELTAVVNMYKYDYSFTKADATENYVTLEGYGTATVTGNGLATDVTTAIDGKALVIAKDGQGGVKLVFDSIDVTAYAHIYVRVTNKATKALYINLNYVDSENVGKYWGSIPAGGSVIIDASKDEDGTATGVDTLSNILIKNDFEDCSGTIEIDEVALLSAEQCLAFAGEYDFASPWDLEDASQWRVGQLKNHGTEFDSNKAGHNHGIVAVEGATGGYALWLDCLNNDGEIGTGYNSCLSFKFAETLAYADYSSIKLRLKLVDKDGTAIEPTNMSSYFYRDFDWLIMTADGDDGWYICDAFIFKNSQLNAQAQADGIMGFMYVNSQGAKELYIDYIELVERVTHKVTIDGVESFVDDGEKVSKPTTEAGLGQKLVWLNGQSEYDFDTPVTSDLTLTSKSIPLYYYDASFAFTKDTKDATNYISLEGYGSAIMTDNGLATEVTSAIDGKALVIAKDGQGGVKLVFDSIDVTAYAHVYVRITNNATKVLYVNLNYVDSENVGKYWGSIPAGTTALVDVLFDEDKVATGIETLSNILIKNDFEDCSGTIEIDEVVLMTAEQAKVNYDYSSPFDFSDAEQWIEYQLKGAGTEIYLAKAGHNNGIVAVDGATGGYALCLDCLDGSGSVSKDSYHSIKFAEPISYSEYSAVKIRVKFVTADGSVIAPLASTMSAHHGTDYEWLTATADGETGWYFYDGFGHTNIKTAGQVTAFMFKNSSNVKYLYVDYIELVAVEE